MSKYIFISGSPRKGNTDHILNRIFEGLESADKEIVYLSEKKIAHCNGCLTCDKTKQCVIRDDMDELLEKLKAAEVIVLGTPNYFDNVPGLIKDFIDRTNPLYKTDSLKGKKVYAIVVGGGKIENSKRVAQGALRYFIDAHRMNLTGTAYFQALRLGEIEKNSTIQEEIARILDRLKQL